MTALFASCGHGAFLALSLLALSLNAEGYGGGNPRMAGPFNRIDNVSSSEPLPLSVAGGCPEGWVGPYRDACYMLVTDPPLSWTDASSKGCQQQDSRAHLAAVTYDNNAYLSKRTNVFKSSDYHWVGLRSKDSQWNQGSSYAVPVDFTKWETIDLQEPDGSAEMGTDCVLVTGENYFPEFKPVGSWHDHYCRAKHPFMCEVEMNEDSSCPSGWTVVSDKCLKRIDEAKSWHTAMKFCSTDQPGARLFASDIDLTSLTGQPLMDTTAFWIALRSTLDKEGKLRWRGKGRKEVTSTFWLHATNQEPNGSEEGETDCVLINGQRSLAMYTNREWADFDCSFQAHYLCELQL